MIKLQRILHVLTLSVALGFTTAIAFEPIIPDPPTLSSSSHFLMDYHTGTVIAEHAADEKVDPASITKLMTAYIVYQALAEGLIHEDDEVTVSAKTQQVEGSRMFLEQGSKVMIHELLLGLVVQSGNDASVALAEHVAGEEEYFVAMMNTQAKKLGMKNSHFANSVGFTEENHYMSARDIAILARALIHDFPERYKLYAQKEYTYNNISQYNRNRLLWRNPNVDGLKTGFTEAAKFCLAASAKRDGMRLISVVLGSPAEKQRFSDTDRLFSYGFRFYNTYRLFSEREQLHKIRVWGGEHQYVGVGVAKDFYITLPRHTKGKLSIEKDVLTSLSAPVQNNHPMGTIKVSLKNNFTQTAPLVALETVIEGGWWTRLKDSFIKLF